MSSVSRTQACLDQIARWDGQFHALRVAAPDALEQASARDREPSRGAMHGIPVLIKDNIDVAGMPTTGGALALEHSTPAGDAPLVMRLRASGAVILGKANLTELANFMTEGMPSGYSSLGGQVLNPYDTSLTPSGSSSGSAAAVALGMCEVAIGTETDGSITSPASHQSLVGLKPSLGLISRTGVIPIAASQDTPGPLARTVSQAAALLEAIAGPDPLDPATTAAYMDPIELDYLALKGTRLGVVAQPAPEDDHARARARRHAEALDALARAGAVLVEVTLPELSAEAELTVLTYELKRDVDRYLAALPDGAPVRSLEQLRDWNLAHAAEALKFRQTHIDAALAQTLTKEEHAAIRAGDLDVVTAGLETAMSGLEALVFPDADGCSWAARAGWPSIVVPAGYTDDNRRPVGLMMVSRLWTDARLLALAYAFEQATLLRREPWEINPAAFR